MLQIESISGHLVCEGSFRGLPVTSRRVRRNLARLVVLRPNQRPSNLCLTTPVLPNFRYHAHIYRAGANSLHPLAHPSTFRPISPTLRYARNQREFSSKSIWGAYRPTKVLRGCVAPRPKKETVRLFTDPALRISITHRFFHSCLSDPLIHHGRHFGRTLHALCNIQSLLTNGILRTIDLDEDPGIEESFSVE